MSARPTPALSVAAPAGAAASRAMAAARIAALTAPDRRVRRWVHAEGGRRHERDRHAARRVWRDRPGAQRRLVGELGALGEALTVVFDGRDHEVGAPPGVEVRFAPHADDAIAELAGPDVVVVTSDRGLAERVRARGGTVESSKAFADRLRS